MTRLFAGTPFDRPPHCDRCGELETECTCPPQAIEPQRTPPDRQTARLKLEKRTKGKMVTIVLGLSAAESDLPALLSRLKSLCGAGGCLNGDAIEIQGDQLTRIRAELQKIGYKVSG